MKSRILFLYVLFIFKIMNTEIHKARNYLRVSGSIQTVELPLTWVSTTSFLIYLL